jgi:hypothetical protein
VKLEIPDTLVRWLVTPAECRYLLSLGMSSMSSLSRQNSIEVSKIRALLRLSLTGPWRVLGRALAVTAIRALHSSTATVTGRLNVHKLPLGCIIQWLFSVALPSRWVLLQCFSVLAWPYLRFQNPQNSSTCPRWCATAGGQVSTCRTVPNQFCELV